MTRFRPLALAAALLLAPVTALAHGEDGRHGGTLVDAPPYHLELVAKGKELMLHVMDDKMAPVDVTGATASATVLAGGKSEKVELKPAGAAALAGQAGTELGHGAKVVASITLKGAKPVQARFEVGH